MEGWLIPPLLMRVSIISVGDVMSGRQQLPPPRISVGYERMPIQQMYPNSGIYPQLMPPQYQAISNWLSHV